MPTLITPESPNTAEARALIAELTAELEPLYPSENRHGYSVAQLLMEEVAFFLIRHDGQAAGCGGVKVVEAEYAEIKRMYVRPRFRGLGLAKLMLNHLGQYAHQRGLKVLRLETGIHQHIAISLYERMGFQRRPPFGEYQASPLNQFYEKRLD